jgi:hypothetical protein
VSCRGGRAFRFFGAQHDCGEHGKGNRDDRAGPDRDVQGRGECAERSVE